MGVAVYQTRADKLPGTNYREVYKKAQALFAPIRRRTKRKPYIRSAYFGKDKIFFDYLWTHLRQKHPLERARRLKYFVCALDLIQFSYHHPDTRQSSEKKSVLLHRFGGVTRSGDRFYVQIQEHKPTGTKQLMSVFPEK